MGKSVYVTSASLQCGHGGSVLAGMLSSQRKLTVSVVDPLTQTLVAKPVLTTSEVTAASITPGCSQTVTASGQKPCTAILSLTSATASKLTVGGVAVVLADLAGNTDGVPKNTDLSGSPGQSKLTAS